MVPDFLFMISKTTLVHLTSCMVDDISKSRDDCIFSLPYMMHLLVVEFQPISLIQAVYTPSSELCYTWTFRVYSNHQTHFLTVYPQSDRLLTGKPHSWIDCPTDLFKPYRLTILLIVWTILGCPGILVKLNGLTELIRHRLMFRAAFRSRSMKNLLLVWLACSRQYQSNPLKLERGFFLVAINSKTESSL